MTKIELGPGWRRQVSMHSWHTLQIESCKTGKYADWDMKGDSPPWVMVEFTFGESEQSSDLGFWADDTCEGLFYYRDWTDDGIPFVADGEKYWAGFWFQKLSDARAFQKRSRGHGSWEEGFEDWSKQCNARRNQRGSDSSASSQS